MTTTEKPKLHWKKSETHGLLPDPEPREVKYTIISVDDHLVEPPGMFEGRLPRRFQDLAPKIVETAEGHEVWEFDGQLYFQVGLNAVVGRKREDWKVEPTRFEEMRAGCYDIDARVKDMDINGVWASVNFPSQITGFCGRVFSQCSDPELGLAVTQAWNDWFAEEWHAPYPERIVPMGITYLGDPEQGADGDPAQRRARLHRRHASGATAPGRHAQPLPGVVGPDHRRVRRDRHGHLPARRLDRRRRHAARFADGPARRDACSASCRSPPAPNGCGRATPVKHPELKIAMSEGGIGWVAMLHDRLENIVDRSGYGGYFPGDLRPAEVLHRNFWFCTIDDPSTICTRETVGVDHVMFETDYPHGDGTWPDSQAVFEQFYGGLAADEIAMISHENAAALFRHPLPPPGNPHAAGLRR